MVFFFFYCLFFFCFFFNTRMLLKVEDNGVFLLLFFFWNTRMLFIFKVEDSDQTAWILRLSENSYLEIPCPACPISLRTSKKFQFTCPGPRTA